VWHLQEKADAAEGRFRDATVTGRHATGFGLTEAATVPGIIGNTQTFDPANKTYISLGDVGALREPSSTVSMWVKGPGNQNDVRFFSETGPAADPIAGLGTGAGNAVSKMDYYARNDAAVQLVDHARTQATAFDGAWHHVALVQDLGSFTMYVDGKPDTKGSFKFPTLFSSTRTNLGAVLRSSISGYFTGNIDEVQISRVARSPEYLRALYENQKPGQTMVSPPIPDGCTEKFGTTRDTVRVAETSLASVAGVASCALRTTWSRVVGESTLEPIASQGLPLAITGNRVSGDSTYRLRFRALYGNEWRSKDVVVRVVENVPDPEFTLAVPPTWNGLDSLTLQPIILNLDAIHAGPAPVLNYTWSRTGTEVTAKENPNSLTLVHSFQSGILDISLCIDNGGAKKCKSATLNVQVSAGLRAFLPKRTAIDLTDGFIEWNAPSKVRILSLDGKILLDRSGRPGQRMEISPALRQALNRQDHRIQITMQR
ncbi:MAG TPA: LamG domain-containing protein, partial [Fibrobacteria bacterium]|nr:LamG domain-containing protein [Fibrobacteria bacterium]